MDIVEYEFGADVTTRILMWIKCFLASEFVLSIFHSRFRRQRRRSGGYSQQFTFVASRGSRAHWCAEDEGAAAMATPSPVPYAGEDKVRVGWRRGTITWHGREDVASYVLIIAVGAAMRCLSVCSGDDLIRPQHLAT
jgi:hypothetical protein